MKRALALAVILLLTPGLAHAQYSLGFRGGLTSTELSIEDPEDEFGSKTGIVLGGFVQFPLSDMLGLQTGLNYTQKGAEEEAEGSTFAIELAYLEVPVLGVLDFSLSGPLAVRVMAGPVVSFEMSCDVSVEFGDESESEECDAETNEVDTESLDFGLQFGGGLLYDIQGAASLFIDVAYNLGLRNINADDSAEADEAKNRALMFTVGVDFPMGG